MTISIDLFLLETWQRFQNFCFHIVRAEHKPGHTVQLGATWDAGRDVLVLIQADEGGARTMALQSKFTRSCGASTKQSVLTSIEAMSRLGSAERPATYILCLPIDPPGRFVDWFRAKMSRTRIPYEIWGRAELLARLEKRPDIFESFFFRVFAELESAFVVDELELRQLKLDPGCQWTQPDRSVLLFSSENRISPDLVLDVIVRNRGRLEACLRRIVAHVDDWSPAPHGLPPKGLLFPKITYSVGLGGGQPGRYEQDCETPLLIRPRRHERFKIRLTETGYSWNGVVGIELDYGGKMLRLPWLRLST